MLLLIKLGNDPHLTKVEQVDSGRHEAGALVGCIHGKAPPAGFNDRAHADEVLAGIDLLQSRAGADCRGCLPASIPAKSHVAADPFREYSAESLHERP